MKICPIALAAGCARCPLVSFCPLKTVLGDYRAPEAAPLEAVEAKQPVKEAARRVPAKPPGRPGAGARRRRKRPRG
ncbi:MAG: hypothetical protein Fur0039_01870 [Rhodocyclaceae bacterium]